MSHPNPVVIPDSGVPEVEQETVTVSGFWADVARHHARLAADRAANLPVTPAEERTGVSAVQHAVAEEVADARKHAYAYGLACEALGEAFGEKDGEALVEMRRVVAAAKKRLAASFDRIEQWTRGGAS